MSTSSWDVEARIAMVGHDCLTLAPWPLRVLTLWETLAKQRECIRMLEGALRFYGQGPDSDVANNVLLKLEETRGVARGKIQKSAPIRQEPVGYRGKPANRNGSNRSGNKRSR